MSIPVHGIFIQILKGAMAWGFTGWTWLVEFSLAMHQMHCIPHTRLIQTLTNSDHTTIPGLPNFLRIYIHHISYALQYIQQLQPLQFKFELSLNIWTCVYIVQYHAPPDIITSPHCTKSHNVLLPLPHHAINIHCPLNELKVLLNAFQRGNDQGRWATTSENSTKASN